MVSCTPASASLEETELTTLLQLVARQVAATPEAVAVVDEHGGWTLTYAQLDRCARATARLLEQQLALAAAAGAAAAAAAAAITAPTASADPQRQQSAPKVSAQEQREVDMARADKSLITATAADRPVGVCAHGAGAVVAVLAAWHLHRPFIPFDPAHPAARLRSLAAQTEPIAIIFDPSTQTEAMVAFSSALALNGDVHGIGPVPAAMAVPVVSVMLDPSDACPSMVETARGAQQAAGAAGTKGIGEDATQPPLGIAPIAASADLTVRKSAVVDAASPPAGYKCKKCKVQGHFFADCPQKKSNKFKAKQALVTPTVRGADAGGGGSDVGATTLTTPTDGGADGGADARSDLAYIMFTSGSTGQPKAVLGSHASMWDLHFSRLFSAVIL